MDSVADTDGPGQFIAISSSDEDASPPNPIKIEGANDISAVATEEQRRYFPSAQDPSNMCISCGCEGHSASKCPSLVSESENGEGKLCLVCRSSEHLSPACTQLYRSYRPNSGHIPNVARLTSSCSACGSKTHFVTDCESRKSFLDKNPTWSLQNRDQYVDPNCGERSIEESSEPLRDNSHMNGRMPETRIRGRASRMNNVHYFSEGEDSEVEFLRRRPVRGPAAPGQIQIASNIQMPNDHNSKKRHNPKNRGAPNQPTLPPGMPLGPAARTPHALPPKPPINDYRNVPPPPPGPPKSYRGGGGRGGRGRGRGRGRGG